MFHHALHTHTFACTHKYNTLINIIIVNKIVLNITHKGTRSYSDGGSMEGMICERRYLA